MGAFEGHKIYGIKIRESADDGSDFANPEADYRIAFLGEDGLWHVKDSAGAVSNPYAAGAVAFAGVSVYHDAAQNLNSGSETTLAFNQEEYDTDAFHDPVTDNGRLVIPSGKNGYYVASLQVAFTPSTSGTLRSVRIYTVTASGATTALVGIATVHENGAIAIGQAVTIRPLSLVATDYFEARCFVDGASLQALSTADWTPRFSAYRVGT